MRHCTLLIPIALLAAGCGGKSKGCETGQTGSCTCPDGGSGTRTCTDGEWGACDCAPGDADTDGDVPVDGEPDGPCTLDSDCQNGVHCDGEETCVDGECAPGEAVVCDDDDDCTVDECREEESGCVFTHVEAVPVVAEIRVSDTTGDSEIPSIAWTGSEYGVAWLDGVLGATTVHFARVSAAGSVVGAGASISEGTDHFPMAQIDTAWTGSEFAVVWLAIFTTDTAMSAILARVSDAGARIGSEIQVTNETTEMMGPSLAWTGSEIVVGWSDYRADSSNAEIYLGRFQPDGTKVGSDVLVPFAGAHETLGDLVWSGSELGMFWHEYASGPPDIHFSRLTPTGTVTGTELALTDSETSSSLTRSAAWTGSEYGVAYMGSESGDTAGLWDIHFGRVSAAGEAAGTSVQVSTDPAVYDFPPVAWTGSGFAIAWSVAGGTESEIALGIVAADGTVVGTPVAVTADDGSESNFPGIAASSSEIAVGWKDARDTNSEVYLGLYGPCE